MTCELRPAWDFLFSFFQSALLENTIDIAVTVRMIKGIHSYRKEHTSKQVICNPWSWQMKPFHLLRKKIEAFEGEKKDETSTFHSNSIKFTQKKAQSRDPGRGPTKEVRGD